jgi:O-antigen/teichoic acid export membrane protein
VIPPPSDAAAKTPLTARALSRVRSASKSRTGVATQIRILAAAFGILQGILVARLGGPDVKGAAAAFIAASTITFQIVNLDLGQQIVRYVKEQKDTALLGRLMFGAIACYAVVAAVVAISTSGGSSLVPLISLGALSLLINMFISYATMAFRGPVINAWSALIQQFAFMLAVVVIASSGILTTATVLYAVIVGYLVPVPFLVVSLPRPQGDGARSKISPRTLILMVKSAMPWHVGLTARVAVYSMGVIAAGVMLGADQAGVYSVAVGVAMLGQLISQQVSGNAYYRMNSLNRVHLRTDIIRILTVELSVAGLVAFSGYWLIGLLYGQDFSQAYPTTLMLLPGSAAWGVVILCGHVLRVFGRPRDLIVYAAPGVVVLLALIVVTTPRFGLSGIALSTTLVMIAMSIAALQRSTAALRESGTPAVDGPI